MPGESRPPFELGNQTQRANQGGRPRKTDEMRKAEANAKAASTEMVNVLIEIARGGTDEKARITAADKVLDRAFGKPAQAITGADGEPLLSPIDWSRLTDDQLRALVTIGRAATSGTGDDPSGGGGTSAT